MAKQELKNMTEDQLIKRLIDLYYDIGDDDWSDANDELYARLMPNEKLYKVVMSCIEQAVKEVYA